MRKTTVSIKGLVLVVALAAALPALHSPAVAATTDDAAATTDGTASAAVTFSVDGEGVVAAEEPVPPDQEVDMMRANWNGFSAQATFSDDGGGIFTVFRSGSVTTLLYAIWGNDPTSEVCHVIVDEFGNVITICNYTRSQFDYGWGRIPSDNIQLSPLFAHLITTPGPGFSATHCTTDRESATPVTTCEAGVPGLFDVTWARNDLYVTATNGMSEQGFGAFSYRSTGAFTGNSAYVNGTVNGRHLIDAPGLLGDSHGNNVIQEIIRTH